VHVMLDDPVFFAPFVPFFDPRLGRPSTPMEIYLRLMFLKFRRVRNLASRRRAGLCPTMYRPGTEVTPRRWRIEPSASWGRHLLVVETIQQPRIELFLQDRLRRIAGQTWGEVAAKVSPTRPVGGRGLHAQLIPLDRGRRPRLSDGPSAWEAQWRKSNSDAGRHVTAGLTYLLRWVVDDGSASELHTKPRLRGPTSLRCSLGEIGSKDPG
jgi:hypothetical protein